MESPRSLRPNPFSTYRDPQTGYWITVVPEPHCAIATPQDQPTRPVRVSPANLSLPNPPNPPNP